MELVDGEEITINSTHLGGLGLVGGCEAEVCGVQRVLQRPLAEPLPHRGRLPHVPHLETRNTCHSLDNFTR